ncbi:hypothetical protein O181_014542 [Austropuccinia psidii MF-1]|uniref:Integrase zinc-binding domain-containing protein n=1 Tax=Austropuccinia psidii MF-1 TaxID=1389203 RepID=A0A9Q3C1U6_9BASI|nr:hypothetical protein [Austropuccinia psidii MF-1]
METDRRKKLKFSEWVPEFGTSDGYITEPEGKENAPLAISSSELHNEFFISVTKTHSKHKQCSTLFQILQPKYGRPELESMLDGPWLREFRDKNVSLIDGLLYHREKNTSALTLIDRDHVSQILKECHDYPYMEHMGEYRTKERVSSTAWLPQCEPRVE